MADWILEWTHLPGGVAGHTYHDRRLIVMDRRLSQAERRSVLSHELCHAERMPLTGEAVLDAREEEAVRRMAARRLIPFSKLEAAVRWSRDPHVIADELWVDVPTLEARIRGLHPSERAALTRALEDSWHS